MIALSSDYFLLHEINVFQKRKGIFDLGWTKKGAKAQLI